MVSTIWILDDDADLGALLQKRFTAQGWDACHLSHPRQLERALKTATPDLLVLDELLPSQRGTDVLFHLRESHPHLPVLMLSALSSPRQRVIGLEAGANDYLGKPFLFQELQLRVKRLLSLAPTTQEPVNAQAWLIADLHLDPVNLRVDLPCRTSREITRGDMALLQLLCSRAGDVVSRQELGKASGSLVDVNTSRSIDVRVSRLRRLLESLQPEIPFIETVRGQGYRLVAPVEALPDNFGKQQQ